MGISRALAATEAGLFHFRPQLSFRSCHLSHCGELARVGELGADFANPTRPTMGSLRMAELVFLWASSLIIGSLVLLTILANWIGSLQDRRRKASGERERVIRFRPRWH